MNNPSIIDEIRNYREEHARKFDFDLDRIVADAQQVERKLREEGWNIVTLKASRQKTAKVLTCNENDGEYAVKENTCEDNPTQTT